jgi:iron complex transport system substrate-binding protein
LNKIAAKSGCALMALGLLIGASAPGFGAPQTAESFRIVALAPSVTEALFALGAGDQVVGVSRYCDYPPRARELPHVGSYLTPNIEEIVALRPNLIIGTRVLSNSPQVRALRTLGYQVLLVEDNSIAEIEESISVIGASIGRSAAANQLVGSIRQMIASVSAASARLPLRRVLMVVGHEPLVAVGRDTFIDELLKMAAADNVADRLEAGWPRVSIEYVIASKPEVILDAQAAGHAGSPGGFWARYEAIPAVRNRRVYGYPEDPVLHPGPRIGESLEILASLLHPEDVSRETSKAYSPEAR